MSTQSSSSVAPRVFTLLLGVLVALGGFAQPAAGQAANAWSVTWVEAGQGGTKVSEFLQTGPKNWYEKSSEGTFDFNEIGRDDNSVYLHDPRRNMRLEICLQSRKVYYADANNARTPLYDVLRSSTYANGWILRRATYGQGGRTMGDFLQTGTKTWREVPAASGAKTFDFNETQRDSDSVDLHDPARNMNIRIDLQSGKIYYSDANNARSPLYDIVSSSAEVSGWMVQRVSYGKGEYRQTGDRAWEEVPSSGSGSLTFKEAGRDNWKVYLDDPSRGVRIEIDLHSRKIYYTDANTSRRELYDVLGASP